MVLALLFRSLPLLLPIATGWWLTRTLGPWQAALASAVLAAALVAAGVLALRATRVGELTWRNRVAGLLLPWGYRFSGQLPAIAATSWLVWTLLASATALSTHAAAAPVAAGNGQPASGVWSVLELLAWVANGGLLLYTLGHRGGSRSLRKLQTALVLMLGGSLVLHCLGHTGLAALLAGGLPLGLGLAYGGYVALLLVVGRNARWN